MSRLMTLFTVHRWSYATAYGGESCKEEREMKPPKGEGKPPPHGMRRKAAITYRTPTGETQKHNATHNNTTHDNTTTQYQQQHSTTQQPHDHPPCSTRRNAHHTAPPSLSSVLSFVSRLLSSVPCLCLCLVCLVSFLCLSVFTYLCSSVCLSVSLSVKLILRNYRISAQVSGSLTDSELPENGKVRKIMSLSC